MSSEIAIDQALLAKALATAGKDERLRELIFDALREADLNAEDPAAFREQVRWPLVLSLLGEAGTHRVVLDNGLVFEVAPDSRIEKSLLLSTVAHPDHVWEPQTTKLLAALGADASQVIVGGAYIGDHVLPIAKATSGRNPSGVVHAFEPMERAFNRLLRNLEINDITNVVPRRLGLWDRSNTTLRLEGHLALASSLPVDDRQDSSLGEVIESVSIDDYVNDARMSGVGLIMLDTEGGEERALAGARKQLEREWPDAPQVVFEVHRNFVDWSDGLENTSIIKFMTERGYKVFAIRDLHSNYPMTGQPIEVIPVDRVYLDGPPHGFNLLASKEPGIVERLGLVVIKDVSPKLILDKDPALHHPTTPFAVRPDHPANR